MDGATGGTPGSPIRVGVSFDLFRTSHSVLYPNLGVLHKLIVRHRHLLRLAPGSQPYNTKGSVFTCSISFSPVRFPFFTGSRSIRQRSPLDSPCQSIETGASPIRAARCRRREVISHAVAAVPASHRSDTSAVHPAKHMRNVLPSCIALQWRFQLMAIQAARMLQHA
jgi:hypothetical protein